MRVVQSGGVKRVKNTEEYRVVLEVFLTEHEKDLWGANKATLVLKDEEDAQ